MPIDDVQGFREYAIAYAGSIQSSIARTGVAAIGTRRFDPAEIGANALASMHCSGCGGERRMAVTVHSIPPGFPAGKEVPPPMRHPGATYGPNPVPDGEKPIAPSLFTLRCSQCDDRFTLLAYRASTGDESVIVMPRQQRGAATPNTPPNVGYYIDQAERSRSVGARSAAIGMYRSAVEMLLHEQGYRVGMLSAKITNLEADQEGEKGPAWVKDVSTNALQVLKALGNAAMHPNDGDVSRQDKIDAALLVNVENVVRGLCRLVYEAPVELEETMRLLNDRAREMTEAPAEPKEPPSSS